MRFENSAMLFLAVLPLLAALLLLFGIWSRQRVLKSFGNAKTVQGQLVKPSPYLRAVKGILIVLATFALVVAASRPQYGGRIRMLKKTGIDIVVALDFSKSMLAKDVKPSRLERAKLELGEFIEKLTGDRIGLVAFAGDTMQFPLTTDYDAAVSFWKDLGPYDMPVGGTAVGKALTAAYRMLVPENQGDDKAMAVRSKAIVLLTDGEDHFGSPLDAAKEAAEKNIRIFTVGIGSDSPELIPRYLDDGTTMGYQKDENGEYVTTALSKENEDALKEIAAVSQGKYFRAGSDLSGLADVVSEIRKMKQSDIESRQQEVYEDVFQWFLIPAFVLLLLAFILPDRFDRKGGRRPQASAVLGILFVAFYTLATPGAARASQGSGLFMSENGDVKDGNKLLKEGKAGEAVKAYEKAARALPNQGAVHLNRGLAIMRMDEKQIDQAMQAFKTAADAEGSEAVQARAHFNLGNTFFKKEDFAEAVREYKKSLMLVPGNKDAAWNLELAKQKQKEKEEQQKKDQQNQDQQNQDQDQQNQDQDQQNQDQDQDQQKQDQDQQKQDQDQQKQDQDQQKQDQDQQKQDQDQQKQDRQQDEQKKLDEQKKQNEQQQQEAPQQQPQPKTRQEVEQLLNSLDNEEDNLQKQMAKRRAVGMPGAPRKDW